MHALRLMAAGTFLASFGLAPGCSSDEGSGAAKSGDYEPPGNGVPMDELPACTAITAARDARRNALGCGPETRPPCPGYLSQGHEQCSQYDQGAVAACADWISKLSCDELRTKKCIVKVLPATAGKGCPEPVDSGSDAADAAADAAEDAPADVTQDAPADSVADGAVDAGDDGFASDASGDAVVE